MSGKEMPRWIIFFMKHYYLRIIIENKVKTVSVCLGHFPQPRSTKRTFTAPQNHYCLPTTVSSSSPGKTAYLRLVLPYSIFSGFELYVNHTVCFLLFNFFDSKLCLRFTHDVVYGNIVFIFIMIEYSFEWSLDHALNHSINGRGLSLFPVLDLTNTMVQITMMTFGRNIYYDFCVFNSVLYFYFLNGMLYLNESSYAS